MRTLVGALLLVPAFCLVGSVVSNLPAQQSPHKEKALGREIAALIHADEDMEAHISELRSRITKLEVAVKSAASKACRCDHPKPKVEPRAECEWRQASDGSWLYGREEGGVFRYSQVYRAGPACTSGSCGR